MIDQCHGAIQAQYQLRSSTMQFEFEGLNRALLAENNTVIVCQRSRRHHVLKQVDRQGHLIKQVSFVTQFAPEFVLLAPNQIVILVKIQFVDCLVLWNLSQGSQTELELTQSSPLVSDTTLIAFEKTRIICLIENRKDKSQLSFHYFVSRNESIELLGSSSFQSQCSGQQVRKLNEFSSLAFSAYEAQEHIFKITTHRFDEQLKNRQVVDVQIAVPVGLVGTVSDLWEISPTLLYIQLKTKWSLKLRYLNYVWDYEMKTLVPLPNLSTNNRVQWTCGLRSLPCSQIREQKKEDGFVIYFLEKTDYRIVGLVSPKLTCYEQFTGSVMISYKVDRKLKQMRVQTWDLPPPWHGSNTTAIFTLLELASDWDEDLLDQISKMLSPNSIQVAQLIQSAQ